MKPLAPRLALNLSFLMRGYIPCSRPLLEGDLYSARVQVGDIVDTLEDIRTREGRVQQIAESYAQQHGLEVTAGKAVFDACHGWWAEVHVYRQEKRT